MSAPPRGRSQQRPFTRDHSRRQQPRPSVQVDLNEQHQRASPDKTRAGQPERERHLAFVEQYMTNGGNALEAVVAAGLTKNRNSAKVIGRRLLTNANVQRLLVERQQKRQEQHIATRAQRQAFWTAVMNDENAPMQHRLRGSELLGKSQADFIEVCVAPILTDEHASDEELVAQIKRLMAKADERAKAANLPLQRAARDVSFVSTRTKRRSSQTTLVQPA